MIYIKKKIFFQHSESIGNVGVIQVVSQSRIQTNLIPRLVVIVVCATSRVSERLMKSTSVLDVVLPEHFAAHPKKEKEKKKV